MSHRTIASTAIAVIIFASTSVFALNIQDIVNQASEATYRHYLDDLLYTHLGDDRGFGPEHDLARDNIYTTFEGFNLDTALDPFLYNDSTDYNVLGLHPGTVRPDDWYILGAHYDSANNPGADDNASGTAGIIEAARVLSQYDFEASVLFIAFDREEQGLYGSTAYAAAHADDNILAMLSLDMIAYDPYNSNTASIHGREASNPLKQGLAEAISFYSDSLTPFVGGPLNGSDHAPFEDEGFQACLLIEYDSFTNPNYHQPTDSVDTLNYIDYAYATDIVRGVVGYIATEAVLIPEPASILLFAFGSLALTRAKLSIANRKSKLKIKLTPHNA